MLKALTHDCTETDPQPKSYEKGTSVWASKINDDSISSKGVSLIYLHHGLHLRLFTMT